MKLRTMLKETVETDNAFDPQTTGVSSDMKRGLDYKDLPAEVHADEDPMMRAITYEGMRTFTRRASSLRVDCAREALAQEASEYHDHPSRKMRVVGIAGGSECSTIAFMVRHVLEKDGVKAGLLTPVRNDIHQSSERVIYSILRTAEAQVHGLMSRMVKAGCEACVFETDLEALSCRRSLEVDFDFAIYSNLNEETNSTIQHCFQSRLPREYRESLSASGMPTVTINRAHKSIVKTLRSYELVMTYDFTEEIKLQAQITSMTTRGTSMLIRTPQKQLRCRIPLVGEQNIYNALATVGICLKMEISETVIESALQTLPMVPGQLERVDLNLSFDLFIDEARTEGLMAKTISTLSELTEKRLIVAFGCPGHQRVDVRMEIGRRVAQLADFSIITTDNPRNEPPLNIAAEVVQGFISQGNYNFKVELDRELAVKTLVEIGQPGDVLLIAGKGHERFQEVEDAIVPFDDRIYAREMADCIRPLLSVNGIL